jgi:hypothetical protein
MESSYQMTKALEGFVGCNFVVTVVQTILFKRLLSFQRDKPVRE